VNPSTDVVSRLKASRRDDRYSTPFYGGVTLPCRSSYLPGDTNIGDVAGVRSDDTRRRLAGGPLLRAPTFTYVGAIPMFYHLFSLPLLTSNEA